MRNVIISSIFSNYMSGRIWMGLDANQVKNILEEKFKKNVQLIPFQALVSKLENIPKGSILFYSSIYNPEYLQYIKDTITFIAEVRPDIALLPNQTQLRSLENKGYQEYYKKQIGIERVLGKYYGDIEDLLSDSDKMNFPFVLKLNEGALSSGVQLIKNQDELKTFRSKVQKKTLREKVAYYLNKKNSFNRDSNLKPTEGLLETNFNNFFQKRKPIVTQEFIPNLECDYKVLIFGERYFVLKRDTRKNDFRASGSGNFMWVKPPEEVLSHAKFIFDKMNVPFISFDIGIDRNKECYLFEFQGTAFGPLTLTQADKYFTFENDEWRNNRGEANLEESYAFAINYYIKKLDENN